MSWYLLTYQGRNVQGELTKGQNIHKSLMVSVTVIQHPLHCKHVLSQIAWTWLSPIHSLQDAVSMIFNIHLPTKDSSSLLSVGVRDIGPWSDCNDFGGLTFGAGIVLACFQTGGTNPSRTNVLKIAHNGPEIQCHVPQNPVWDAIWARGFVYLNASRPPFHLLQRNHIIGYIVIVQFKFWSWL